MFYLDGTYRYWLYNKPVDMRKSFNGLSGIVTNAMSGRLYGGDVFIFVNSSRNMMKLLRKEEGGLVLYCIRLDMGRMRLPDAGGEEVISTSLAYENVVGMVHSALDSPYVRRIKVIEVKAHKRDVRKPVLSNNLPIEETHIYPEGVQDNPDYVEIGVENTDTLAIQPAKMYVKRIVRHKFVLRSQLQIEDPDRQTFLIAPLPETIRPKSMVDASLLADILINKYIYHLPFYRQIQKYKELGVLLNDATINDWFTSVCERLRPLYDKLREQIMSSDYIQVDESTLPVIDNEKHRAVKGYMWAVRNALTGDVYFHYDMGSRSGDTARKLIGGYRGAVQTDGYEVYESFENMPGKRMIGCWAHVRRKFVEALDENKKYASVAIVYIGKLYKIEEEMRDAGLTPEEIKERRQKESYPIIQEFEKWMDSVANAFTPKSRMGKALVYTYTLLPRLSRYVLDGRYNIDNNGIENAIRPLALGRKNFLFDGNHDAAIRAAIVYSLFSSCKAASIEPREWLEDILVRLPAYTGDLGVLLPCNWQKVAATSSE